MATAKKKAAPKKTAKTARGNKQDRKLVASQQTYEVSYVTKLTGKSAAEVKKAIKDKEHSRVKVMKALSGDKKSAKSK